MATHLFTEGGWGGGGGGAGRKEQRGLERRGSDIIIGVTCRGKSCFCCLAEIEGEGVNGWRIEGKRGRHSCLLEKILFSPSGS